MNNISKGLVTSAIGAMGIAGIAFMVKALRPRHVAGMYEKVGRGIDERLKESKTALDKAAAHVQSVFDHIK
jgi:hypothetical protein